MLLTPHDVQMGLIERARGGMVVVSALYPSADTWFRFDPPIDFSTAMPPDQQPTIEGPNPDPPGPAGQSEAKVTHGEGDQKYSEQSTPDAEPELQPAGSGAPEV